MGWTEKVQIRLAELGFDPGPADGVLGGRTRRAIQKCQSWHANVADKKDVDPSLWPNKQFDDRQFDPIQPIVPRQSPWPHESGVPAFYGRMGNHLKRLKLPYPMRLAWDLDHVVESFSVHEKVHDSAERCFQRIRLEYTESERENLGMNIFSGCLSAPRKKRGGSTWSMHCWAIAIDFDDTHNRLRWHKNRARLARADCERFWQIWESEGWMSLGREKDYDWMHVQAASL